MMATATRSGFGFGGRSGVKRRGMSHGVSLNLTPMIDLMTIMLIFLIKSYSISPQYLTPAEHLKLAVTTSDSAAPDKVSIALGLDGVRVEGKLVVSFSGTAKDAKLLNLPSIPALQKALTKLKLDPKMEGSDTLIIQADRALSFDYVKPILRTAGAAGFHDIKFAGIYED